MLKHLTDTLDFPLFPHSLVVISLIYCLKHLFYYIHLANFVCYLLCSISIISITLHSFLSACVFLFLYFSFITFDITKSVFFYFCFCIFSNLLFLCQSISSGSPTTLSLRHIMCFTACRKYFSVLSLNPRAVFSKSL